MPSAFPGWTASSDVCGNVRCPLLTYVIQNTQVHGCATVCVYCKSHAFTWETELISDLANPLSMYMRITQFIWLNFQLNIT